MGLLKGVVSRGGTRGGGKRDLYESYYRLDEERLRDYSGEESSQRETERD